MSLACFECGCGGEFDTLILFSKSGFQNDRPISHYPNFYTDCASVDDFTPVQKSQFAIVQEREGQDQWFTGNDGAKIADTKRFQLIDEMELSLKLPKICEALKKRTIKE